MYQKYQQKWQLSGPFPSLLSNLDSRRLVDLREVTCVLVRLPDWLGSGSGNLTVHVDPFQSSEPGKRKGCCWEATNIIHSNQLLSSNSLQHCSAFLCSSCAVLGGAGLSHSTRSSLFRSKAIQHLKISEQYSLVLGWVIDRCTAEEFIPFKWRQWNNSFRWGW